MTSASLQHRHPCLAPSGSMYFDQFGKVRACCQNTGVLMGDVVQQTLSEIWNSAATHRLRNALARHDYSEGCGFCRWQLDQGDDDIVFARVFDDLAVTEPHPPWPVQMEFSMTNSCNLQCVMCNGDWSSSIRTHREHRPSLPKVYGERFFDELAEFLPHLNKANFLGGEPFLGQEPLRVLSMLADLDQPPTVAVTTNGTQWSGRIESICDRLPLDVVVSLDGITKDTYESIRVGADFDVVMGNIERFRAVTGRHGGHVSLAHCLMRSNWRGFSRLLRFAEDRGMSVGINEVLFPPELSLFQLPLDELTHVVDEMERDRLATRLTTLRPVWDGQLDALRHRRDALAAGTHTFIRPWSNDLPTETWEAQAARVLGEWCERPPPVRIDLGPDGTVVVAPTDFLDRFDLQSARTAQDVLRRLEGHFSTPATTRRYTDMLDDVVITDATGATRTQFRASWNSQDGRTTMMVSVRDHPLVPADAASQVAKWCAEDRVVHITCDTRDRVLGLDGPVHLLDIDVEAALGAPSTALFDLLRARHGAVTEIEPGPSGYVADTVVTFHRRDGSSDDTGLSLRVMADRSGSITHMWVGVAALHE